MDRDLYRKYLASPEWKAIAHETRIRYGNECALCCSRFGLEVHHRHYQTVGRERPSDLVLLCQKHHRMFHGTEASDQRISTAPKAALIPFTARLPFDQELN